MPDFSPNAAAASTTSAAAAESVRNVSTAITRRAPARARRARSASGTVGERVGAEQHEQVDAALGGGGEDAASRRARPRRASGRAAGRRRRCRGAAPGSTVAPGQASSTARSAAVGGLAGLGEVGPPGDDDDRTGGELVGDLVRRRARRSTAPTAPASTGTLRQACGVSPVAAGPSSRILTLRCSAAWRSRRWRTRQLLLEVGAEEHDRARRGGLVDGRPGQGQQLRPAARRRAGRRGGRCRARRRARPRRRRPRSCRERRRGWRCCRARRRRAPRATSWAAAVIADAPRRLGEPALAAHVAARRAGRSAWSPRS